MCRSPMISGGAALWLAALLFCALTLCTSASIHVDNTEAMDRKPWMDGMERGLPNDVYMNEFINRLRALKEAEDIGLAQYELDSYFRKHVPFFHLSSSVPVGSDQAQTVYPGKRGVDFGLGRGFSGSQAAKHLMGLAAASYAGGPGRRRRSATLLERH